MVVDQLREPGRPQGLHRDLGRCEDHGEVVQGHLFADGLALLVDQQPGSGVVRAVAMS